MNVQIFTVKGIDVEVLFRNGYIAYAFTFNNQPYGVKLPINKRLRTEQKKIENVISIVYQLLINAYDTIEALQRENK